MTETQRKDMFDISGMCIAITGGAGILCSAMAKSLAARGARIAVIDYDALRGNEVCKEIESAGGFALPVQANVLDRKEVEDAFNCAVQSLGRIDVLINGAGGNKKDATVQLDKSFFQLPDDALQWVFNLNCIGTILPSQVFGKHFAARKQGQVINITSMCGYRPLTNVVAYSAAKAAIVNFTQWLSVHMAMTYSPDIRVNAIAPGFFLTEQNRFLLMDEKTGNRTPRGQQILDHTPAKRYGEPEDLIGTLVWLISEASRFVTGIVVPVDGGFSAYAGV